MYYGKRCVLFEFYENRQPPCTSDSEHYFQIKQLAEKETFFLTEK